MSQRIGRRPWPRWSLDAAMALALVAGAWVLRAAAANQFVTWDEPAWVYRSVHFMLALGRGDPAGTLLVGHPGVVTMWLGSAGLAFGRLTGAVSAAQLAAVGALPSLDVHDPATMRLLAGLLPAAKTFVPPAHALLIGGLYAWLRRLWGRPAALAAALLLALDPYALALSRVLHMDALAAEFMLAAVAATWAAAGTECVPPLRRVRWAPIIAGVATGLAALTKAYGLFAVPVVAVLWLAPALGAAAGAPRVARWRRAWRDLGVCALAAAATFFLLWPAMWVAPARAVGSVIGLSLEYASAPGDATAAFFRGETGHDFGAAFYPLTILYRTTPLALLGAGLALVGLIGRRPADAAAARRRRATLALLFYVAVHLLLLSLSAKQFDRYALPAMLAIDLLAALGLIRAAEWLRRPRARRVLGAGAALLTLFQGAWLLAPLFPADYLAYANPLCGGTAAAIETVPMGWGEGIDQVGAYLAAQPSAEELTVATWAIAGLAGSFTGELTVPDAAGIARADYVLVYIGDVQMGNELATRWHGQAEPVFVARVNGQPYAWLYANTTVDTLVGEIRAAAVPGDAVVANTPSLLGEMVGETAAYAELPAGAESEIAAALNALAARVAAENSDGLYYVAFDEANAAETAIVRQLAQGAVLIWEKPFAYGTLRYYRLPAGAAFHAVAADHAVNADFAGQLRLEAAGLAAGTVQYRQEIGLALSWQALAAVPGDYHLFLRVLDAEGRVWGQHDAPLKDVDGHRLSAWAAGSTHLTRHTVALEPGIPAGDYQVVAGLYRLDDLAGLPITVAGRDGGLQLSVAEVAVTPPLAPASEEELDIPNTVALPLDQGATIIGYALDAERYPSGEAIGLTLYWRCTAAMAQDYELELILRDDAGRLAVASVSPAGPGHPTGQWVPGETLRYSYRLTVPPETESGAYTLALNLRPADGGASLPAEDATLAEVAVEHVERLYTVPQMAYAADVRAGEAIELLGYDLSPERPQPGEAVALTLYWRALAAPAEDYTVFVHLLAPDGSLFAQRDAAPADGARPTSGWLPGEIIVDRHELTLGADAAAGTYGLAVGLYLPASGARLPLTDASGATLPDGRLLLAADLMVGD